MGNRATFLNGIWQTKILKENIINETQKTEMTQKIADVVLVKVSTGKK